MLETTRNGYLTNVTGWVAESRADPNIPARTLDKRLPGNIYLLTIISVTVPYTSDRRSIAEINYLLPNEILRIPYSNPLRMHHIRSTASAHCVAT